MHYVSILLCYRAASRYLLSRLKEYKVNKNNLLFLYLIIALMGCVSSGTQSPKEVASETAEESSLAQLFSLEYKTKELKSKDLAIRFKTRCNIIFIPKTIWYKIANAICFP